MNKWIAEFDLEDGDKMPEHMDLNYMGGKIDFHCRPMWILCSERMPEEEESCWAKYYGTDKWRNGMFRKCSEFVDVTVVRSDGKREVTLANTIDGKWVLMTSWIPPKTAEVIAWKPRVEPYMGEVKA